MAERSPLEIIRSVPQVPLARLNIDRRTSGAYRKGVSELQYKWFPYREAQVVLVPLLPDIKACSDRKLLRLGDELRFLHSSEVGTSKQRCSIQFILKDMSYSQCYG